MFPFPTPLLGSQVAQYIGSTAAVTDGAGNASIGLPAGTMFGDLLIFLGNGAGLSAPSGGGPGSWSAKNDDVYCKVVSGSLTNVTAIGGIPNFAVLLVVLRGASGINNSNGGSDDGAYPLISRAGIAKTSTAIGMLFALGSTAYVDTASGYTMTSPAPAITTNRSQGVSSMLVGFFVAYPDAYVSSATWRVTATGGSIINYNSCVALELI